MITLQILRRFQWKNLRIFTETNNLVNSTINNFVDKVGTFKKQNIQNMLDFD